MIAPGEVLTHHLVPHPDSPAAPVRELSVRIGRDGGYLLFTYRLEGNLDELRLPEPGERVRTDGLWRHTCFEAFVGRSTSPEYCEYNFSPSGAWAIYHFSGYRTDMRPHDMSTTPGFHAVRENDALTLSGTLDLRWTTLRPGGTVRLGVTAVIEDRSGLLSYWALKHPPGKPDFHHADGFVLDVL